MSGRTRRGRSPHETALGLLDEERRALVGGQLAALPALVEARERLLAELLAESTPPPDGFLVALRGKAERNSRLLLASLEGLRAARDQMAEAERAAGSLRTYTAAGTSVEVAAAPRTRDRRR